MQVAAVFLPIWILALVGYLARRCGLLGEGGSRVLGRFVFHIAMPPAIFLALIDRNPPALVAGPELAVFAVSTGVVMLSAWWLARGRSGGDPVIWSMAGGYVNSANLGIPVAVQVIGDASLPIQVILFQVLVVTPLILIGLEHRQDQGAAPPLRRLLTLPLRNPVILAAGLGLAVSASGVRVPESGLDPVRLLAQAAVPTALIALGASLRTARSRADPTVGGRADPTASGRAEPTASGVAVVAGLKLVAQPAVAYVLGRLAGLSSESLLAVAVCAGLPTAQNTFIFAQKYRVAEAVAARTVLVTTVLSLGTLAGIAAALR